MHAGKNLCQYKGDSRDNKQPQDKLHRLKVLKDRQTGWDLSGMPALHNYEVIKIFRSKVLLCQLLQLRSRNGPDRLNGTVKIVLIQPV